MLGPVCLGCVWFDLGIYSTKSGGALFHDVVLNLFGAYALEIGPGWGSSQPGNRLWEREFLCQKLNNYVCIYYEQVRCFIGLQLKFIGMYIVSCLVTPPPSCAYPQLCELIFYSLPTWISLEKSFKVHYLLCETASWSVFTSLLIHFRKWCLFGFRYLFSL